MSSVLSSGMNSPENSTGSFKIHTQNFKIFQLEWNKFPGQEELEETPPRIFFVLRVPAFNMSYIFCVCSQHRLSRE